MELRDLREGFPYPHTLRRTGTFPRRLPRVMRRRLDYMLLRHPTWDGFSYEVGSDTYGSDHFPLIARVPLRKLIESGAST